MRFAIVLFSAILLLIPALGISSPLPEDVVLLDEVVAIVNGDLITRSTLLDEARVLLVSKEGGVGLEALGQGLEDIVLIQALDYSINQRLIQAQVELFGFASRVSRSSLISRFERNFTGTMNFAAFLDVYGLRVRDVVSILKREHISAAYLSDRRPQSVLDYVRELRNSARIVLLNTHGELEKLEPENLLAR